MAPIIATRYPETPASPNTAATTHAGRLAIRRDARPTSASANCISIAESVASSSVGTAPRGFLLGRCAYSTSLAVT
eukprot:243831-Prymnesium_polylepis.1